MAKDEDKKDTVEREDWARDVGPFMDCMRKRYPHFDHMGLQRHNRALADSKWEALAKLGRMEDVVLDDLNDHLGHLKQLVCQADNIMRVELAR